MAHIHLGEGSFPLWALVLWTLLGAGLVSAVVYRVRNGGIRTHQIALAGIGAAASFAIWCFSMPPFRMRETTALTSPTPSSVQSTSAQRGNEPSPR